ncbi:hypothetical protein BB558_001090 [Smittium angustum]|uniref:CDC45-like protein n=1 Tax=Smittium angustum TaxID=133377 RepID=A0A2U1J539_SMIAN|nr:hypothetical protein BB558_003750 [Smittium angustum]PWA02761.1 hypothetical protein BB558_001090 [Smittium angustum]
MVYLTADQYEEAYKRILDGAADSTKDGTGACSVLVLVANDPDALCAARILFVMLKHDFIAYKMVPVSNYSDIIRCNSELIDSNEQLRTVVLINCGATVDIQESIKIHDKLSIIIIDSHRPYNLYNIFWNEQILCLDDGDLDQLEKVRQSFNYLEFQESDNSESEISQEDLSCNSDSDNDGDVAGAFIKAQEKRANRRAKKEESRQEIANYYSQGAYYGQSAAVCCFQIAELLGKPTVADTVWWAIVGITSQICLDQIDNEGYMLVANSIKDTIAQLQYIDNNKNSSYGSNASTLQSENFFDPKLKEVNTNESILNDATSRDTSLPTNRATDGLSFLDQNISSSIIGDDLEDEKDKSVVLTTLVSGSKYVQPRQGIYASMEFKFFMVRHWSLESAMKYSSFITTRLGTWSSRGKSLFDLMIAKLGLARTEIRQSYTHLDPKLKNEMPERWERIASDYNLEGALYLSFVRAFGWRFPLASASDHVWALIALLASSSHDVNQLTLPSASLLNQGLVKDFNSKDLSNNLRHKSTLGGSGANNDRDTSVTESDNIDSREDYNRGIPEVRNWKEGFYLAYDSLSEMKSLQMGFELAMKVQSAIVDMGSQMLERRSVKTLSRFKLVVINDDCVSSFQPFLHSPLVLIQLGQFILDALRNHGRSEHLPLPFVLAVLDPLINMYLVLGIATPEYISRNLQQKELSYSTTYSGEARNRFGIIFEQAASDCDATIHNSYFDASVISIHSKQLPAFINKLRKHA